MKKIIISALSLFSGIFCYTACAANLYLGPTLFLQDNTTHTSNYRGLEPMFSVGYAHLFDDFYLAGEVFGVPFTGTLADNHTNAVSARTTRSLGVSILPGGMITENILGFVRLGVLTTEFSSPGTSRSGGHVGVGLQTCLTTHWDMRVEYIYTGYQTVPTLGSVKADQVGLGFVYKVLG